MKAFIKSLKFIGASLVFLALAACGKNDSSNNVAAVQYGYQNGQCYDITHNTPVAYNYCTTGQYQYINNQCVLTTNNNQVVDPSYCQQSQLQTSCGYNTGYYPYNGYNTNCNNGYSNGYNGAVSCAGREMYYYNGYSAQLVFCDAYSCRGQFLYDYNTRVRVYCY